MDQSPSLLLSLVQRLPDDSLTVALMRGGRQHFGFGRDMHLLSDIFDAQVYAIRANGNWEKGKVPNLPSATRPDDLVRESTPEAPAKATVRELYARFAKGSGGI